MKLRILHVALVSVVIGLCWLLSAPAQAQHRRGSSEVRKDRREARDDRRDLEQIVDIAAQWRKAVRRHDKKAERAADQRLRTWLQAEIRESEREAAEARNEARGPGPGRRDDIRDARQKQRDANQTRAVAIQLRDLQRKFRRNEATPSDYQKKRALLDKLVVMAQRELRESREEIREDRREKRRDRRRDRRY